MKRKLRITHPPIFVITVKGPSRQKEIEALLDTGSAYNVLSIEDARDLGYDIEKTQSVNIGMVGGKARVPVIKVSKMDFLGFSREKVSTLVLNMKNSHVKALIGWSFLKHFYFSFDPGKGVFTIGD